MTTEPQTPPCSPSDWRGDPVYKHPSACRDERNTYRIFHRDIEGRVIAEFYGDNAKAMAERFCQLFGEPSGSRKRQCEVQEAT